jgi:hypothetical protein
MCSTQRSSLEGGPHAAPVERGDALDRIHRFGFVLSSVSQETTCSVPP